VAQAIQFTVAQSLIKDAKKAQKAQAADITISLEHIDTGLSVLVLEYGVSLTDEEKAVATAASVPEFAALQQQMEKKLEEAVDVLFGKQGSIDIWNNFTHQSLNHCMVLNAPNILIPKLEHL
jgi:hypothetical protein